MESEYESAVSEDECLAQPVYQFGSCYKDPAFHEPGTDDGIEFYGFDSDHDSSSDDSDPCLSMPVDAADANDRSGDVSVASGTTSVLVNVSSPTASSSESEGSDVLVDAIVPSSEITAITISPGFSDTSGLSDFHCSRLTASLTSARRSRACYCYCNAYQSF